jgi:hypothetical protein
MEYRYIFYGGARERNSDGSIRQVGMAHNNAFLMAAKNVEKSYRKYPEQIKIHKITTAADMLGKINSLPKNSLKSLDILSHGTPYSLNFSIQENENSGLVTGFMAKMLLKTYYSNIFDGEIYNFGGLSRYVDDINFDVFTSDTRVQIHGCNTARGSLPGNTFAEAISIGLWDADKRSAYVIGHTSKSNPNINGAKTTIADQDYRHGERAIIKNGSTVYTTIKKGYLDHDDILRSLSE